MANNTTSTKAALPNGRLPESRPAEMIDIESLRARVEELELLCAEVYVAAVEIGLPHPLLNRLWTVAAHGSTPHAFAVDMPPRPAAPPDVAPMPIPDIRLTDRRMPDREGRPRAANPELKPLPERRRVMVVDDDPMMIEVLVRILQR